MPQSLTKPTLIEAKRAVEGGPLGNIPGQHFRLPDVRIPHAISTPTEIAENSPDGAPIS
jgi:hypothetical protein